MEQKIQLQHPQGKKAVSISKDKYDLLKKSILKFLIANKEVTYSDLLQAVTKEFETNKIKFEGSLGWYLEWVKLDLEARQIIKKIPKTMPQKFLLAE